MSLADEDFERFLDEESQDQEGAIKAEVATYLWSARNANPYAATHVSFAFSHVLETLSHAPDAQKPGCGPPRRQSGSSRLRLELQRHVHLVPILPHLLHAAQRLPLHRVVLEQDGSHALERQCRTLPDCRRVEPWSLDLGLAGSKPLYPALFFRGAGIKVNC